jgi:hypothetical protein
MIMDPLLLLVQLVGGGTGASVAASLFKTLNLGTIGNLLAGMIGGFLGGNVVNSALGISKAVGAAGVDPGVLVSQFAGCGVGGGLMMILVGMVRQVFSR